jgi:glycosyltransferase involved in cell wall biosynthesis
MTTTNGQRPRVLQCLTRLGLGGAEKVAFSLIRGLRAEIDFAVFTVRGQSGDAVGREMEAELRRLGVPWYRGTRLPLKAGGPLPGGWALARAIRDFRPDIIHCHAEPAEACAAVWAACFAGHLRPAVVRTIHNSMFWRFWPRIGRWCDRRLARAYIAYVSEAARDEFVHYRIASRAGAPAVPPVVIYNGVALPRLAPRTAPLDPGVRRVLFAGRFENEKAPDVLCRALPLTVLPPGVRGELRLVGRGRHDREIRRLAAHPPPGWCVKVQPPVPDLPALMRKSDLMAVPSRFEGLGLIGIEATFCGLPVVAANAKGLSETLPADHPWLARPGNPHDFAAKLGTALHDTDQWAGAVAAAQEFAAARFAPAEMLRGYRTLYADAVSEFEPEDSDE